MKEKLLSLLENPILDKFRFLILPAVSLITTGILIVVVIIPQILSYPKTDSSIKEAEDKLTALNQKLKILETIDEASFQEDLDLANLILPPDSDIAGTLGQTLFLIRSSSLNLSGVSFGGAQPVGQAQALTVKTEITGTPTGLKTLTQKVKESPRIMRIASIEMTQSTKGDLTAAIIFLAYFQNTLPKVPENQIALPTDEERKILSYIKNSSVSIPETSPANINVPKGKLDPFQ